jgi:PKD repeat protein
VGFVASMGCPFSTSTSAPFVQACNVAVTLNGVQLPSGSITNVTWDWGDGFTNSTQFPSAAVNTHSYASAGTYRVFASVTGAPPLGTPQTATTSLTVTVPKPAAAAVFRRGVR